MSSQIPPSVPTDPPKLTASQWLLVILASIGFLFDIYEILVLPLIAEPAMQELLNDPSVIKGSAEFTKWGGLLFFLPAIFGGLAGLLGGYLTDLFGRRRVLTWSILIYAISAFLAGFSTSMEMLLILRCTTFAGVCVEFVAAVAWLAEMFSHPKQRERVLGYTQAFSSAGGLAAAFVFGLITAHWAGVLPAITLPSWASGLGEIQNPHAPWRYALMSGAIPAIPLIIIRPFLPESPVWQQRKDAGTLKRPSLQEVFAPKLRKTTIITTIMFACSYGAAFGALQQTPRMLIAVPEVSQQAKEKLADVPGPQKKATLFKEVINPNAAAVTKWQEFGGLAGRFLLALLVIRIVSRRTLIRIFQIPGLIMLPLLYLVLAKQGLIFLEIGIFIVGLCVVGQFSFWGNYLPRVYPLHLRGTGSTVAANIGGRILGTSFAWFSIQLAGSVFAKSDKPPDMAEGFMMAAAVMGTFAFLLGFIMSFFLPEPAEDLPEEVEPHAPQAAHGS